jgi:hypothetical protein
VCPWLLDVLPFFCTNILKPAKTLVVGEKLRNTLLHRQSIVLSCVSVEFAEDRVCFKFYVLNHPHHT